MTRHTRAGCLYDGAKDLRRELLTLVMTNHTYLQLLVVTKEIMVVHLTRHESIGPGFDSVGQEESARTATNGHLINRSAQQLVALYALHIEAFAQQQHEIVGCQRLLKTAYDARRIVDMPRLTLRSEEHTSELQSRQYLVCRLLL